MNAKEFREFGYLQEVNRQFLHPLGLALEVFVDEDGNETLGGIWDYRDDPEGINFDDDFDLSEKARRVALELTKREKDRRRGLGYMIQPVNYSD